MLIELRLNNMAVAEEARLSLGAGLNVLSGSTGAGKSLVVEALHWLHGQRVDSGLVRQGAERASAVALFDVEGNRALAGMLDELGLPTPADGVLELRREVRTAGRSRAYVGGQLSSAATLEKLSRALVELQSQHQQLVLLAPSRHASLLDACGVDPELREVWDSGRRSLRSIDEKIHAWKQRQILIREQSDLLSYQSRELQDASLSEGELARLRESVARMEGGAGLMEALHAAREVLDNEETGALRDLRKAVAQLQKLPEHLTTGTEAKGLLEEAVEMTTEALNLLDDSVDREDFDGAALDEAQIRLSRLEELMRKYRRSEAELVELRDRLAAELAELNADGSIPGALTAAREDAIQSLQLAGKRLHDARKKVARRVAAEAPELLRDLGMAGASLRFDCELSTDPEGPLRVGGKKVLATPEGPARIRLLVRTNTGEAEGPVEEVASGGELSRIGLVLRTLSLATRLPALVVLDEIDAGLGADLGPAVAARLKAMSARSQLLVISHLPAVAAAADHHICARKGTSGDRTVSHLETLDRDGRQKELARMIGGGPGAKKLAKELLDLGTKPAAKRQRSGKA